MSALSTHIPGLRSAPAGPPATPLNLSAIVGPAGWARLPAAVQRRFAQAHADIRYAGHIDLRCNRIGRFYAALAQLLDGPLTHLSARDVPSTVRVHVNDHGGVVWERRFQQTGDSATHLVRSTKEPGPDGDLVERTNGGLCMALDVFEENGALVFRSKRYWFSRGWLRIPVPTLLAPGVCRVTHTDLGAGLFRFRMSMVHPLWGETFHQSGVFADPVPENHT